MSLVRLENVNKNFAGEAVLRDVNMRVEEGARIALIGRNGTGKTTLFRLITGDTAPDGGVVERMRRARIVYLAQMPEAAPDATIHEIALTPFAELLKMERALRKLEGRLADGGQAALQAYGDYQQAFIREGGYEFRTRVNQILCGLGFSQEEFSLPFHALSGGWRARLMLSLALLREADLLLLDEPENHLDMDAREWLEEHLQARSEAMVLISHDRRMINTLANQILEVERGALTSYSGNYNAWLKEKALRREQQQKAMERQGAFIRKEQAWIDRFRYKNTKARQVQSRIKRLEKMEMIEAPPTDMNVAGFNLGDVERSGNIVVDARHLSMAYDNNVLYSDLSFSLHRGERLGVIGPNGSGKTTLLRQLAGYHDGLGGTVRMGHNVRCAFYEQHQEHLRSDRDLLEEMQAFRPDWTTQQCRSYLGRFLFSNDDVFKRIPLLSGGERSRLALAKLIASDANLLLLDEPTNHLDIESREALESSLAAFPGAMIVVSHDRTLIDRLVERLVVVQNGCAQLFLGNFSDYRRSHQRPQFELSKNAGKETAPPSRAIRLREEKKAREREERRIQRQCEQIEADIAALEREMGDINEQFANLDPADYERGQQLKAAYDQTREKLDKLYDAWMQLNG